MNLQSCWTSRPKQSFALPLHRSTIQRYIYRLVLFSSPLAEFESPDIVPGSKIVTERSTHDDLNWDWTEASLALPPHYFSHRFSRITLNSSTPSCCLWMPSSGTQRSSLCSQVWVSCVKKVARWTIKENRKQHRHRPNEFGFTDLNVFILLIISTPRSDWPIACWC